MCLADLYSYSPEQRESIARLESLLAMRSYVEGVRNSIRADISMPAKAGDTTPCGEPAAAGAFSLESAA